MGRYNMWTNPSGPLFGPYLNSFWTLIWTPICTPALFYGKCTDDYLKLKSSSDS